MEQIGTFQIKFQKDINIFINILNATSPGMSFQHIHFYNASKKYKVSMDWFFGNTNIMHLPAHKKNTITSLLNEALIIAKELGK